MKKYKLKKEYKDAIIDIALNLLVGPLALLGFIITVLFGLLIYFTII